MDDIRRVATNTLMRVAGSKAREEKTVLWHGVKIVVRPFLSFGEYLSAVRSILDSCCGEDGVPHREVFDISARSSIVSAYALVRLPSSMDDVSYLLFASDLYDTIISNVCSAQVESILQSVKDILGWR